MMALQLQTMISKFNESCFIGISALKLGCTAFFCGVWFPNMILQQCCSGLLFRFIAKQVTVSEFPSRAKDWINPLEPDCTDFGGGKGSIKS